MNTELLDKGIPSSKPKEDLNNVNGILAMGIVSVVLSLVILWGILSFAGLILGILAIVKGYQAIELFIDYPNDYTISSFNKGRAGFVCGIVGASLWVITKLLLFVFFAA